MISSGKDGEQLLVRPQYFPAEPIQTTGKGSQRCRPRQRLVRPALTTGRRKMPPCTAKQCQPVPGAAGVGVRPALPWPLPPSGRCLAAGAAGASPSCNVSFAVVVPSHRRRPRVRSCATIRSKLCRTHRRMNCCIADVKALANGKTLKVARFCCREVAHGGFSVSGLS